MAGTRDPKPRLALGSVAATVVRLPRTEAALASGAGLDEAARVLENEIQPIDDLRSTADYRKAVAINLLRSFWAESA
jgi:xanthine dehydrogenase iron-sulfur cluster and FAD-binding subunit A